MRIGIDGWCHFSGHVFRWGVESGRGWMGHGEAPIHRGTHRCNGCGRDVQVRNHMMEPTQYGMIPRHKAVKK